MNYWKRYEVNTLSRRKLLASSVAGFAAAGLIAACSSSNSSGNKAGARKAAGLVAEPKDTYDKAVRGGTLRDFARGEPASYDPGSPVGNLGPLAQNIYGTLLTVVPGHLEPSRDELVGDFAEKYEFSPDRLQVTLKMRRGIKWHNRPPVNGRQADIDDVLFSWRRYTELSTFRALVYNKINPQAPVISVSATDSSTLVIKLKEPVPDVLSNFAWQGPSTGWVHMIPKEAESGFDIRHELIGHGPFELGKAEPSVGFTLKRNPAYYDKNFALIDQIDMPIVSEYATQVAQFKSGNIYRLDPRANDLVTIKGDQPKISVYQTEFGGAGPVMIFGQLPDGKSIFLDERVRQAVSMAIDRKSWIEAVFNTGGLAAAGLPMETRWNSHLSAGWDRFWLDPQAKEFGPNAKYFQLDISEAKKLLSAAGYPNGFEVTSAIPVGGRSGASTELGQLVDGMMPSIGIKVKEKQVDYTTDYIPHYRDGNGQFEGWAYATGGLGGRTSAISAIASEYWPSGGTGFRGFSASGKNDMTGDPKLNAMIEKARLEFDVESQVAQAHEIQRYLAKAMWGLNPPGGATGFNLAWPALQNVRVWRVSTSPAFNAYRLWIDKSLPPFT